MKASTSRTLICLAALAAAWAAGSPAGLAGAAPAPRPGAVTTAVPVPAASPSQPAASPSQPAASPSQPAGLPAQPGGQDTLTVSPASVAASANTTLTFTYTAAQSFGGASVSMTVPPGWTPPTATAGQPGYVTCSLCNADTLAALSVAGATITVSKVRLTAGQVFALTYGPATAPASAAPYTFAAAKQPADDLGATLAGSPVVTVTSPAVSSTSPATGGGPAPPSSSAAASRPPVAAAGVMTVSPRTVQASHPVPLTFTYQAPAAGLAASGEVTLAVPPGWTPPSAAASSAGYTSSGSGTVSVAGRRIAVTGTRLGPGQSVTITYRPAATPRAASRSVFTAAEEHASAAALTALAVSPSVTVADTSSSWRIPVPWLLALLAAACAACASAVRFLRRRGPPAPAPSGVRTEPHAGPPPTLTVQPTGTGTTRAVAIEPQAAEAVTTIEEARP